MKKNGLQYIELMKCQHGHVTARGTGPLVCSECGQAVQFISGLQMRAIWDHAPPLTRWPDSVDVPGESGD